MSKQQYKTLLFRSKVAWDEAEAESERIGNPYKNRHGVMVRPPPKDMVGVALQRYCEQVGLHYC